MSIDLPLGLNREGISISDQFIAPPILKVSVSKDFKRDIDSLHPSDEDLTRSNADMGISNKRSSAEVVNFGSDGSKILSGPSKRLSIDFNQKGPWNSSNRNSTLSGASSSTGVSGGSNSNSSTDSMSGNHSPKLSCLSINPSLATVGHGKRISLGGGTTSADFRGSSPLSNTIYSSKVSGSGSSLLPQSKLSLNALISPTTSPTQKMMSQLPNVASAAIMALRKGSMAASISNSTLIPSNTLAPQGRKYSLASFWAAAADQELKIDDELTKGKKNIYTMKLYFQIPYP